MQLPSCQIWWSIASNARDDSLCRSNRVQGTARQFGRPTILKIRAERGDKLGVLSACALLHHCEVRARKSQLACNAAIQPRRADHRESKTPSGQCGQRRSRAVNGRAAEVNGGEHLTPAVSDVTPSPCWPAKNCSRSLASTSKVCQCGAAGGVLLMARCWRTSKVP